MKTVRICIVSLVSILAGCANVSVSGNSGGFVVVPQGSFSYQGSSGGVLLTTIMFAALTGIWRDPASTRVVPEMLESRGINEVDCTQPIEDWSKNLRCR